MIYVCAGVVILAAVAFYFYRRNKREKQQEMAQGIQIFNSGGDLIFELTKSTTYVLGTGQTGTSNGSLQDSRITDGSRVWVVVLDPEENAIIPVFTASNGSISWDFNASSYISTSLYPAHVADLTFLYGVY